MRNTTAFPSQGPQLLYKQNLFHPALATFGVLSPLHTPSQSNTVNNDPWKPFLPMSIEQRASGILLLLPDINTFYTPVYPHTPVYYPFYTHISTPIYNPFHDVLHFPQKPRKVQQNTSTSTTTDIADNTESTTSIVDTATKIGESAIDITPLKGMFDLVISLDTEYTLQYYQQPPQRGITTERILDNKHTFAHAKNSILSYQIIAGNINTGQVQECILYPEHGERCTLGDIICKAVSYTHLTLPTILRV